MSILIKGMEIPKNCYDCPCHNGENGRCQITKETTDGKRPYDCPLVEVPTPHGRLIDADVFDRHMKRTPRYFSMCFDLQEQPTIIEAEEGVEKNG